MSSNDQFYMFTDPTPTDLKETPLDFLKAVGGPIVIDITGKDQSRTRVISTLLHGNEPSGLYAVHRWLHEANTPATNVRLFISSVAAALSEPIFTHRFMVGEDDLNRCFDRSSDAPAVQRAQAIRALINEVQPEAIVDLHNTSGSGPAFGVITHDTEQDKALISFFTDQTIFTELKIGSLMEQEFNCPNVTIECGGSGDNLSHSTAYHGLREFCDAAQIIDGEHYQKVTVLRKPLRIEVKDHVSLSYCDRHNPETDISMLADIEFRNVGITPRGAHLGWANTGCLEEILLIDESGKAVANTLFGLDDDNRLVTLQDMRIFMATTRADIAKKDCLFYAVSEPSSP